MKIVVVVGAGMADEPIADLDGKTPLDRARTPHLDHIAARGIFGLTRTIPRGTPVDRDGGLLAALGYDVSDVVAAGVLEAAGQGLVLAPDVVALRCDFVAFDVSPEGKTVLRDPAAGIVDAAAGRMLAEELAPAISSDVLTLHPGVGHRHLLLWRSGDDQTRTTAPWALFGKPIDAFLPDGPGAEVLRGVIDRSQALLAEHPMCRAVREQGGVPPSALWPWGAGRRASLAPLARLGFGGALVAAAPHAVGVGRLAGLVPVAVEGATGSIDTDLRAKAEATLHALERHDLVVVHVEAANAAAQLGDAHRKIAAIERLDEELIGPLLEGLRQRGGGWRLLITSDHAAPCATRAPNAEPVPFAVYVAEDEQKVRGIDRGFSERDARDQGIFIPEAHGLLERLCRRGEAAAATPRES